MKKILKNIVILASAIFGSTIVYAQQGEALFVPSQRGYQLISVPQEFRVFSGDYINYIRIKNKEGQEVPFVQYNQKLESNHFVPIAFQKQVKDSVDFISIQNPERKRLQKFQLKIGNSNTSKTYFVEGSNDGEQWFSLVSEDRLTGLASAQETFVLKTIEFPISDYAFIRIGLINQKNAPINVIDVGETVRSVKNQDVEKIREIKYTISEDKKTKSTLIHVEKGGYLPIHYLQFHISSPKQYLRSTSVFQNRKHIDKKKVQVYEESLNEIELTSEHSSIFDVDLNVSGDFFIRINNEDNPALKIDSISFFIKPILLLSDLQAGEQYSLLLDTGWIMPNYDLAKMNLQLPNSLPMVELNAVSINTDSAPKEDKDGNSGRWILIICSVIGVLVVFYFGNSMLKDMNKVKKGTD